MIRFGEKPMFLSEQRANLRRCFRSNGIGVLLLMLITLAIPSALFAQGTTGTINGTVLDASGTPVANAKVVLVQIATNAQRVVSTTDQGTYSLVNLAPGGYRIKVEAPGFKTFQQNNLLLSIDQVLQINPSLKVGAAHETIEVTASQPVIETEQSSIGLVLDSNNLQNTPLNGRLSLLGMMVLAPGIQNLSTAQDTIPAFGVTLAVGTGRRNSYGGMATTLDGAVNEQISLQRSEAEIPSIDALEQFKVITTGAPAEFSQAGQIIVATKSGTNHYYGELLEYNRSKGTSAKLYSFVPRASTAARAPYERNEFGGNYAGPIRIPHVYDGLNRSFFFASYEGFHLTTSSSANTTQPTLKERQGDFSEFVAGGPCNLTGTSAIHIVDPQTSVDYFNTNGNVIPTAKQNTVSQQLLDILYPTPTTSACNATNTYETVSYTQDAKRFSMRLDHRIGDRDQLRGTFMRAFYGPFAANYIDSKQGGYSAEGEHNVNSILGWTHTFSPTLALDTTASFLHLIVVRQPHVADVDFGSIIPNLGAIQFGGAPTINIQNITGTGDSGGGHPGLEQDAQFSTSLIKIFPRHTVKAGFSWVGGDYYANGIISNGSFDFSKTYSGVAFADFLLGTPHNTYNGNPAMYAVRQMESQYGGYIQDDWKLTRKLTLNLGLRYDLQWFESDGYGRNSLYVPEQQQLVVFGNSIPTSAVSSYVSLLQASNRIETSAQANMSSDPWAYLGRPKTNFAPRAGFAYEVLPRTVLRGGFGVYYNLIPTQYVNTEMQNLPFTASVTYSNACAAGTGCTFTMSNPFSATGKYSANPSVGAQAKSKTPYSESYNLAVERDLGQGFGLRIGYVGQHNLKQNNVQGPGTTTLNLNLPQYPVILSSSQTAQSTYNVQPFSAITLNTIPFFHSTMNSLQVGLHKQFSHGVSANAEYQWTRILGLEDVQNQSGATMNDSYGPASGTTPQSLNLNYTYELPMGRGHALLGNSSALINKIVGGWEYSGVGTFRSGLPFSVTANMPNGTAYYSSTRANRMAGVALYPHTKNNAQWFNPAAFAAPGSYTGTDGNTYAAFGTSGYDLLYGPAWWNMDMNLVKSVNWAEHYNVQLRADSFNTFNHANLGNPSSNISSSSAGKITSTSGSPVYEQRTLEFGAKFTF